MPEPGDPRPGFMSEPGCCLQIVYSRQLQDDSLPRDAVVDGAVVQPQG